MYLIYAGSLMKLNLYILINIMLIKESVQKGAFEKVHTYQLTTKQNYTYN